MPSCSPKSARPRELGPRSASLVASALGGLAFLGAAVSHAAPTLRVQVDQRGDFVMIGNTLGHDCAPGVPAPLVGTIGECGVSTAESAPDATWRADAPTAGSALASTSVLASDARSTAVLSLPPGASVTHAFLYWSSRLPTADATALLERPGVASLEVTATAQDRFTTTTSSVPGYQSVADVTGFVVAQGAGAYRVGGIDLFDWVDSDSSASWGGWALVVLYQDPGAPVRNLAVFDGLDGVPVGGSIQASLDGLRVPAAGYVGRLGVLAYEGDDQADGDALRFNGVALSNALNPADDFFNGTRSYQGVALSTAGDLPRLTGGPRSMSGLDLDQVDVTARLSPGDTSASIEATSNGELYFLGAFVTAISTQAPDLSGSTKAAIDLDGAPLWPGDQVEYDIVVRNGGEDAALDVVLEDTLPAGVSFVPGSLRVGTGSALTEAVDADAFELVAGSTLRVRLGSGANGTTGGRLDVGAEARVRFRVSVDEGIVGPVANQGTVTARGLLGTPEGTWLTGAPGAPGQPTVVDVETPPSGSGGGGGGGGAAGAGGSAGGPVGAGGEGGAAEELGFGVEGGGCGCRVVPSPEPRGAWALGLGLWALVVVIARRRRLP